MRTQVPTRAIVQSQVHIAGSLEGEMQIHYEGVVDLLEDVQLSHYVLYLLLNYEFFLLETFQSIFLAIFMLHQKNRPEGALTQNGLKSKLPVLVSFHQLLLFHNLWVYFLLSFRHL